MAARIKTYPSLTTIATAYWSPSLHCLRSSVPRHVFMHDGDKNEKKGKKPHKIEERPSFVRIGGHRQREAVQPFHKKRDRKKEKKTVACIPPETQEEQA